MASWDKDNIERLKEYDEVWLTLMIIIPTIEEEINFKLSILITVEMLKFIKTIMV